METAMMKVAELGLLITLLYRRCRFLDEFYEMVTANMTDNERNDIISNLVQDPFDTSMPSLSSLLLYGAQINTIFNPHLIAVEAIWKNNNMIIQFVNDIVSILNNVPAPAPAPVPIEPAESSSDEN
jgi:hypothetical protein